MKLDNDSSVPYNWAGWDIKKIELGEKEPDSPDASLVYVTLTNKSRKNVDEGTLIFRGYKDGEDVKEIINVVPCIPKSKIKNGKVDIDDRETMKSGETRTCVGELTYPGTESTATEFRPYYLSQLSYTCDENDNKFDSCSYYGTEQSIRLEK